MDTSEIQELKELVTNSLYKILKFVDYSDFEIDEYKNLISLYKTEKDDEKLRDIRKKLNALFFDCYRECMHRVFSSPGVPPQVQMFLLFGYMDENLAGLQNAIAICKFTEKYAYIEKENTLSLFEWLCLISRGERWPSMNDMSIDYEQELRERLKNKEITENEFNALMKDENKKLDYEMDNVFSIMRRVFGAPTRFLAMFSEDSLEKPLLKSILLNDEVDKNLNDISAIDINLFNHEYTYANPKAGIENVRIQKEIKPDIILLPIIGSRPMMWQEIEGRNRQTPARMFFPVFFSGTLKDSLIDCCGAYRWEFCKREQGARWQDVSDPSLCSYFYNYIQTYKKNHQLSQEQKDKISAQYAKYRHRIKDIFIEDYHKLIANEAEGNIRLNKASRSILMRFCFFNKNIRAELIKNNLYTEYINVVNNRIEHDKKLVFNMKKRVEDNKVRVPEEILEFEALVNR
ncbi:MAG: hypothetical protein Q4D29_05855 [Lachnospiraceae bacterium]|nr:hypothetical protein [Lachnospiraceae bacterium]